MFAPEKEIGPNMILVKKSGGGDFILFLSFFTDILVLQMVQVNWVPEDP